jgi:hypothetical protein
VTARGPFIAGRNVDREEALTWHLLQSLIKTIMYTIRIPS